ncbi:sugar transferase [Desertivirga arenae]|uniref:sugar transferase n=1 Tax=Desertivirga arenae TaxID=2810309 RepID=UPI001A977B19|nr:sugar transferase [Pedobacter sp. SYSU D00823]
MKRVFDLIASGFALLLLSPILIVIAIIIIADSKGPVIFKQTRVGQHGNDFKLLKFRTMRVNNSDKIQITIGSRDNRITKAGYWLRKYKIDELPQLFNILKGEMSIVGPRPEVRKYVNLYNDEQQRVLMVKPGLTDWASIEFRNESDLLAKSSDPESFYIKEIIPAKLLKNLSYIEKNNLWIDFTIILMTIKKIMFVR